MRLAAEAYQLGRLLPKAEEYRLTSQLLRAATSVPTNIAEGAPSFQPQQPANRRLVMVHPDGFGGVAVLITPDAIKGKSTNAILKAFLAEIEAGTPTRQARA